MLPKTSTEGQRAGAGFLAATFDGFTALFPQQDVMTVEQRSRLTEHQNNHAMYHGGGFSARVFSLSRAFQPMAKIDRPYFIVARYRGGLFGLACDELQAINASQISLKSIPASLKCGNSPIEAFAQFGKKMAFQCSLEAIAALLPLEGVEADEQEQSHPA
jgi:hypothetical protein